MCVILKLLIVWGLAWTGCFAAPVNYATYLTGRLPLGATDSFASTVGALGLGADGLYSVHSGSLITQSSNTFIPSEQAVYYQWLICQASNGYCTNAAEQVVIHGYFFGISSQRTALHAGGGGEYEHYIEFTLGTNNYAEALRNQLSLDTTWQNAQTGWSGSPSTIPAYWGTPGAAEELTLSPSPNTGILQIQVDNNNPTTNPFTFDANDPMAAFSEADFGQLLNQLGIPTISYDADLAQSTVAFPNYTVVTSRVTASSVRMVLEIGPYYALPYSGLIPPGVTTEEVEDGMYQSNFNKVLKTVVATALTGSAANANGLSVNLFISTNADFSSTFQGLIEGTARKPYLGEVTLTAGDRDAVVASLGPEVDAAYGLSRPLISTAYDLSVGNRVFFLAQVPRVEAFESQPLAPVGGSPSAAAVSLASAVSSSPGVQVSDLMLPISGGLGEWAGEVDPAHRPGYWNFASSMSAPTHIRFFVKWLHSEDAPNAWVLRAAFEYLVSQVAVDTSQFRISANAKRPWVMTNSQTFTQFSDNQGFSLEAFDFSVSTYSEVQQAAVDAVFSTSDLGAWRNTYERVANEVLGGSASSNGVVPIRTAWPDDRIQEEGITLGLMQDSGSLASGGLSSTSLIDGMEICDMRTLTGPGNGLISEYPCGQGEYGGWQSTTPPPDDGTMDDCCHKSGSIMWCLLMGIAALERAIFRGNV